MVGRIRPAPMRRVGSATTLDVGRRRLTNVAAVTGPTVACISIRHRSPSSPRRRHAARHRIPSTTSGGSIIAHDLWRVKQGTLERALSSRGQSAPDQRLRRANSDAACDLVQPQARGRDLLRPFAPFLRLIVVGVITGRLTTGIMGWLVAVSRPLTRSASGIASWPFAIVESSSRPSPMSDSADSTKPR